MNRIDRISAILIQLQSRRVVKAQDIAERFGISLRTVYRDVKALEEAGIPVIGEAGVGYSLVEGYRLPPVMFTREEATALLTAEKLVEKLTDGPNAANYKSAMYKIKAVMRSGEKDFLEYIDESIVVLKARPDIKPDRDLNLIQMLLQSIAESKVTELKYFTHYRQEYSNRYVEPLGVFYLDNFWHLIAYCRMRNDYRDFRLDRIEALSITDETFSRRHPPLKKYLEQLYKGHDLHRVVIRVQKDRVKYLGGQKYYNGFISQTDLGDFTEMDFLCPSLEGFARWYIMFADHADIIEPEILKEKVKSIIANISIKLSQLSKN